MACRLSWLLCPLTALSLCMVVLATATTGGDSSNGGNGHHTDQSTTGVEDLRLKCIISCLFIPCSSPGVPENGVRQGDYFAVGSHVSFTCNTGYVLSGSPVRVCLADGSWSGQPAVCTLDVCQDPGVPVNGVRIGDDFSVGSAVTYRCNPGHTLNGAVTLSCQQTATWDNVRPSCDNDCILGDWTDWSECSVTCLEGLRTRHRAVLQHPGGIGAPCGHLSDVVPCRPIYDCGCDGSPIGSAFNYRALRAQNQDVATDIVFVMDESSGMGPFHDMLGGTVEMLEDVLVGKGIGNTANLRNHYALVGFGRDLLPDGSNAYVLPHVLRNSAGEKVFTGDTFNTASWKLFAGGNIEDGYLAIEFALRNLIDDNGNQLLRLHQPNVAVDVIFISDEERDIYRPYGAHLTRSSIKNLVRCSGAVLNVVVNQNFYGSQRRAIGYDSNNITYIVEDRGRYSKSTDSRIGVGYLTTRHDYTTVALEVSGTAWDINILGEGGATGYSFISAFVEMKMN